MRKSDKLKNIQSLNERLLNEDVTDGYVIDPERKYTLDEVKKVVKYVHDNGPFGFPIENWAIEKWLNENL